MAKATYFYGTKQDLVGWLVSVESELSLSYRPTGSHNVAEIPLFESVEHVPEFGQATTGDWSCEKKYLLLPNSSQFLVRIVNVPNGNPRYFVDQVNNPCSVILTPGGEFSDGCLLLGELATISKDRQSLALYKTMLRLLKTSFTEHRGVFVGSQASERAERGSRLTGRVAAPPENDFRLERSSQL